MTSQKRGRRVLRRVERLVEQRVGSRVLVDLSGQRQKRIGRVKKEGVVQVLKPGPEYLKIE